MHIVTGANGKLGRLVVERLLERLPAAQIGVSVRDPHKAKDLADRGVRVRRGDFGQGDGLAHAFEGADRILLVSSNSSGEDAVRHHRTAIDAARSAGARHVFYTSHVGASPGSPFAPMPDHAATEEALRASGVPFTSLRNGFYADSAMLIVGPAIQSGVLATPADGPFSWTAHSDLAEATAILMTAEAPPASGPVDLTASEAIDMEGLAALASEITGRTLQHTVVADDAYRATLIGRGVPELRADLFVGMFVAARRGELARVDPTLARLLGRPPTPMRDVMRATIGAAG